MKKLFLLAAVALGMASCSSDVTEEMAATSAASRTPIGFSSYVGAATRAENMTFAKFKQTGFQVWALTDKLASAAAARDSTLFGFDAVTYSEANDEWSYTTTQYWPEDKSVDFYFFAPANHSLEDAVDISAKTLSYSVGDVIENQIDLLWAPAQIGKTKTTEKVQPNFGHALSRIVITARLDGETLTKATLSSIKFASSSLPTSGKMNLAATSVSDLWSGVTMSSTSYSPTLGTTEVTSTTATAIMATDEELLFVPGTATAPVLTFVFTADDDATVHTVKATLDDLTLEAGKSYMLDCILSVSEVKFNVTAETSSLDWVDGTVE